jgi:hypothetical protein
MMVIIAIVCALLLIAGIIVASIRLTERKSTDELKRRIPDGSSVNNGGYHVPGDPL